MDKYGLSLELAEIDENLIRSELTALERAEQLFRRKQIYEELHPEAVAGAKRAAGMNRAVGNNVDDTMSPTFTTDTASATGQSPRSIQRSVKIARDIPQEIRDQIRGLPMR